jgi:UDP-glucose:glycoprotein glucosyltransferase
VYPGQFHSIRKNIYNLVFVVDYSLASSLDTIAGSISGMIRRGLPIRFGVVPMFPDKDDLGRPPYMRFFLGRLP